MALTFQGKIGIPVEVIFSVDSACQAQYSLRLAQWPPTQPDAQPHYQNGPQGYLASYLFSLPAGITTLNIVATPLCPASPTANLTIGLSQNGANLTADPANSVPGNPCTVAALPSAAAYYGSLGIDLK